MASCSPGIPPPLPRPEGCGALLLHTARARPPSLVRSALAFLSNDPQHTADALRRADDPLDVPVQAGVRCHVSCDLTRMDGQDDGRAVVAPESVPGHGADAHYGRPPLRAVQFGS